MLEGNIHGVSGGQSWAQAPRALTSPDPTGFRSSAPRCEPGSSRDRDRDVDLGRDGDRDKEGIGNFLEPTQDISSNFRSLMELLFGEQGSSCI